MKSYKIILVLAGVVVIIALSVGITLGIQKARHRKSFEKRMPRLSGVFGKEKPKDLLDTIKVVRAIEELGLGDEQTGKFISLTRRLSEVRKVHQKERKEKIEGLEKLIKAKASADDLSKIILELEQLEDKFRIDEDSLEGELDNLLTIEQQARYIIFEHEFQHEMKKFIGMQQPMGEKGPGQFKNKGAKRFKGPSGDFGREGGGPRSRVPSEEPGEHTEEKEVGV